MQWRRVGGGSGDGGACDLLPLDTEMVQQRAPRTHGAPTNPRPSRPLHPSSPEQRLAAHKGIVKGQQKRSNPLAGAQQRGAWAAAAACEAAFCLLGLGLDACCSLGLGGPSRPSYPTLHNRPLLHRRRKPIPQEAEGQEAGLIRDTHCPACTHTQHCAAAIRRQQQQQQHALACHAPAEISRSNVTNE